MSQTKFVPKKGQIDFSHIRYCPVINCVVKYQNEIILVRRSKDLHFYPDYWNGVSGFLDSNLSVEDTVFQELHEELGLQKTNVVSLKRGRVLIQESKTYKKTWIVFPVLVEVNTQKVLLDWEAKEYKWLAPRQAQSLRLLPGFSDVLAEFFAVLEGRH